MTRVLVTGAAGYIGRQVMARLSGSFPVVGVDLVTAGSAGDIREMDVRDPELAELVRTENVTHVVHLAAILDGSVDPDLAYDIDVNGTANVLEACVRGGVKHLTVTSSGAAYGYHGDNPVPLRETDPLRGNAEFPYSHHKRLVEELLATARDTHGDLAQLVLRVGTVLGPGTDNLITDLLTRRFIPTVAGSSAPFVFIWDEDLVSIIERGVANTRSGIFNVAGDGVCSMSEIARALGGTTVPIPASVLRAVLAVAQKAGVGQYGPSQVDFLRYRPVLDNSLLKKDFGFTPTRTSSEALTEFAASR